MADAVMDDVVRTDPKEEGPEDRPEDRPEESGDPEDVPGDQPGDAVEDEVESSGESSDGDDEESLPPTPGRSPTPEGDARLPPLPDRIETPPEGTPPRDVQKAYDSGSMVLVVMLKKVDKGFNRMARCHRCCRSAEDHKGHKIAGCRKERKNVDPDELSASYKDEYEQLRSSYKRELERQRNIDAVEDLQKKYTEMEMELDLANEHYEEAKARNSYLEEARAKLRKMTQRMAEKSEKYLRGSVVRREVQDCVDTAYADLGREKTYYNRLLRQCQFLHDYEESELPGLRDVGTGTDDEEESLSTTEGSEATSVAEEEGVTEVKEAVIVSKEVAPKNGKNEVAEKKKVEEPHVEEEQDVIICGVNERLEDSDSEAGRKSRREWKGPEREVEKKKPATAPGSRTLEVRPEDVAKIKAAVEEKKRSLNKAKEQERLKAEMEKFKREWRELEREESRFKKAPAGERRATTFADEASTHPIRRMTAPEEMAPRGGSDLGAPSTSEERIRPRESLGVGSSPPYPGFRDPAPGTDLKHRVGEGAICGGKGDQDIVIKAQKLVKITFKESEDCFEWLEKKRKMMNQMEYLYPDLEIYDLIAIFQSRATDHVRTLEPLLKKQSHYKSFTHFIREFQEQAYPNIKNEVQARFATITQRERGQNIYQFYLEFLDLLTVLGWRADDHVQTFLRKLKSKEIKMAVRNEYISTGEQTLEGVQKHASQIETRMEMDNAEDKRVRQAKISDVSVGAVGMGRGRGAPFRGSFKASRGLGYGRAQGGRHTPYQTPRPTSPGKSGGGGRFERKSPQATTPHLAFKPHEFEKVRAECTKRMGERNLTGCGGCLGFKHKMKPDLSTCMYQSCIFCGKGFRAKGAHVSAMCDEFPVDSRDATALLRQRRLERRDK